jgi:hypothetical protein
MKYLVTITVEETIEVEADSEEVAIHEALQWFDPTAHDPQIIEVWSENEQ